MVREFVEECIQQRGGLEPSKNSSMASASKRHEFRRTVHRNLPVCITPPQSIHSCTQIRLAVFLTDTNHQQFGQRSSKNIRKATNRICPPGRSAFRRPGFALQTGTKFSLGGE